MCSRTGKAPKRPEHTSLWSMAHPTSRFFARSTLGAYSTNSQTDCVCLSKSQTVASNAEHTVNSPPKGVVEAVAALPLFLLVLALDFDCIIQLTAITRV